MQNILTEKQIVTKDIKDIQYGIPPLNYLSNGSKTENIQVQVIDQTSDFNDMKSEWDDLVCKAGASVFQSFSWLNSWWQSFGINRNLFIVTFINRGELVGIAPFYIDIGKLFGFTVTRSLRFIGSNIPQCKPSGAFINYSISDFHDIIVDPDYEDIIAKELLNLLGKNFSRIDRIFLQETSERSWVQRKLLPQLVSEEWNFKTEVDDICPLMNFNGSAKPESLDSYIIQRKARVRTSLRQLNRLIIDKTYYEIRMVDTHKELEYFFPLLVEMHQSRWNDRGASGIFINEEFIKFIFEVFKKLLDENRLWFIVVETPEKAVAFDVGILSKDKVYGYVKSFDHTCTIAKHRPGNAAFLFMIDKAIERNITEVHLLRGGEQYKYKFTQDKVVNYLVTIEGKGISKIKRSMLKIYDIIAVQKYTLNREKLVMATQFKQDGVIRFFPAYLKNLLERVRAKIKN